jgi:aminopeptidase N
VLGTGTLENAEQVLTASGHGRLQRATSSDSTIRVLAPDDFPALATAKPRNGRLVWRMRADSVRDVAFAVARNVHWDARRTTVGDRNGDGVADFTRIDALYRPQARRWRDAAGYAAHAITFLSGFTGIPYPWPHMSAVEGGGIVGGGMEYPMMTLIGDYNDASDEDLYNVVAHELAHMWVPMLVSSDERRYSWLDEGTTTFNETQSRADFLPGRKHWLGEHEQYLAVARAGEEGEMMRRSAFHYSPEAFGVASYSKPASALIALRAVLGDDIFMNGYRTFLQQWKYRHPYPWDFFNTFEAASGRDLDWFWRSWYYETWVLDQAVGGTRTEGNSTRIFVENRGRMPLPTLLQITLGNGETRTAAIPVEHWLAGNRQGDVTLTTQSPVVRVEIDPEQLFPDIDRENNVWPR